MYVYYIAVEASLEALSVTVKETGYWLGELLQFREDQPNVEKHIELLKQRLQDLHTEFEEVHRKW